MRSSANAGRLASRSSSNQPLSPHVRAAEVAMPCNSWKRQRLLHRLGPTVVVADDDERSQLRNRRLAQERLRQRLADALFVEPPRRPTRPSRGSVERRLDAKRQRATIKKWRRQRDE